MTSLTFTECCGRLSVTPKTLRQWLAQADIPLHPHPTDARTICLTSGQLHVLATLHGRVLQPMGNSIVNGDGEHVADANGDLRARLAQMEAQVATLQTQLTDLTLHLLWEREQRTERRPLALDGEYALAGSPSISFSGVSSVVRRQPVLPALVCHPTEKRNPLVPLIEYGAAGRYVLISPEEGELAITPDSPEWHTWLASPSSFRFIGRTGRFSARRGYNRGPNRCWYAQRGIHQKNYSKYIGVSEHVTIERLGQIAASFQIYLK